MVVDNHQEEDGKESWDGAVDNNLALQTPQLWEARVDGDDCEEAENTDGSDACEHVSCDLVTLVVTADQIISAFPVLIDVCTQTHSLES